MYFMQISTEDVLIDSLNNLLESKSVDKITVKDIVSECGLTRQTFYNHFSDIYALVEYSACQNAKKYLDKASDYDNWQEGFCNIMIKIKENKTIAQNVYHSIYRDLMEKYIYDVLYGYIIQIVEKQAEGMSVSQNHKDFIAHFYSLAFIAIIFEWIRDDMKDDPEEIVEQIGVLIHGDFKKALNKYAK
ncbi:TetR family transcriptional regulator [Companilactobacillus bobalius DSM 19674]|uniref:TetR family transcriptional regulator n=2 Tax=Companilactobacillus bobalius TaxID=2801451 RepID=A0A0R1KE02_9LACO|nr:TetR family transcriptional regulator [Companilactobacillus bobalius DSM 19674]